MGLVIDLEQARSLLAGWPHQTVLIDEQRTVLLSNRELTSAQEQPPDAVSAEGKTHTEGQCYWQIHRALHPAPGCPLEEVLESGKGLERRILDPLRGRWLQIGIFPTGLRTEEGRRVLLHMCTELTGDDLEQAENGGLREESLRSQRLECLGRLAGGVAHDFNNLLAVIMNYARFIGEDLGEHDTHYRSTQEIVAASERAAELTRQLLLFSRKEQVEPQVLDMKALLKGVRHLLGRTIGEDIELEMFPDKRLWSVLADPTQLEQVLMNLAINARDAMPRGGRLTYRVSNTVVDSDFAARHVNIKGGLYVLIAVSDTGVGMSEEVLEHIFEPFYTTKPEGKGTGLGLAMAYGVVRQAGGHILVDSKEGAGTRFRIFLPAVDQRPSGVFAKYERSPKAGKGETVLVVEDDEHVRAMCARFMTRAGYKTLQASGGDEVLFTLENFDGQIDLLVTDVVLPRMSGKEVAQRLQERFPQMAVLFMSGHTHEAVLEYGVLSKDARFIQKPFTVEDLLRRVRSTLEGGKP